MKAIVAEPKHKPYKWQVQLIKTIMSAQYTALVASRQQGKTETLIWALHDFIFTYDKYENPRALVCAATTVSAFNNFFLRLHRQLEHLPQNVYVKTGSKNTVIDIFVYRPHIGDHAQVTFCGMGNVGALRGGVWDLCLLDEYQIAPRDYWNGVLRAATKVRKAKVVFTGTPDGMDNPLWRELQMCKKEKEKYKNSKYNYAHLNVYECGVWTKEEIEEERRAMYGAGEGHMFEQEYMARFDAIDVREAPFNEMIRGLETGHAWLTDIENKLLNDKPLLNVVCDIGKAGNCATWFWVSSPLDKRPLVLAYEDKYNGTKELVEKTFRQYQEYYKIRMVFPHDIMMPSLTDGNTRLDNLQQFMHSEGWSNKIEIVVLPLTKDKNELWRMAINKFRTLKFDPNGEGLNKGWNKLSQVRFKKDIKTGHIRFGEPVLNGNQHAADALMYLFADINESGKSIVQATKQMHGWDLQPVRGPATYSTKDKSFNYSTEGSTY